MGKAGKDPEFLESRRLQLLSYMTNVIRLPRIIQSKELDAFLSIKNHQQFLISSESSKNLSTESSKHSPLQLFRNSFDLPNAPPSSGNKILFFIYSIFTGFVN